MSCEHEMLDALQKQYQSLQEEFEAVSQEILGATADNEVRLTQKRDTINERKQKLEQEIQKIQQAYLDRAAQELTEIITTEFGNYPDDFRQAHDWALSRRRQIPIEFDDANGLVRSLISRANHPEIPSLHRFVFYVLVNQATFTLGTPFVNGLSQWAKTHIPEAGTVQRQIEQEIEKEHLRKKTRQPCLLVRIQHRNGASALGHQGDRYSIDAWLIEHLPDYQANPKQPIQRVRLPQNIDSDDDRETTYGEGEIKVALQQPREECRRRNQVERPLIQVFLPIKLMHLNIDTWLLSKRSSRRKTRCLGSWHPLVMRSDDRLNPMEYELSKAWKDKWIEIESQQSRIAYDFFKLGHATQIYSLGVKTQTLAVRVEQALCELASIDMDTIDLFETLLLDTDLPLAMWIRQTQDGSVCQQKLQALLKSCCLEKLHQTLLERRAAVMDLPPDQHPYQLCHNLSLLWDDPTVPPPMACDDPV